MFKGNDLRTIRKIGNKTTSEMAKIVGVKTRRTWENWEKNVSAPSINQFMMACRACGIDVIKAINFVNLRENENNFEGLKHCVL